MKFLWLEAALNDLEAAIIWVADYDLNAALQLDDEVAQLVRRLEQFPLSGRPGRVDGTREVSAGNYVFVYKAEKDCIEILCFIHGARRYSPFPED